MKKILLVSILLACVVGTIALYMLFGNSAKEIKDESKVSTPVATEEKVNQVENPTSGTATMSDLMARGENLECTISYYSDANAKTPTTGTYFTSRGRTRGDFLIPEMGQGAVSSMIMRDETMYSWTVIEDEKYGMKISMKDLEASKTEDKTPDAREVVPLEAKVDYNCKVWNPVDGSIFEIPNDIIFQDFGDLMNTGMDFGNVYEGADTPTNQCSLCDQIEGEAKAQCKAAFSC
jgi:hypothetical protein